MVWGLWCCKLAFFLTLLSLASSDFGLITNEVILTTSEPKGSVVVNVFRESGSGHEDDPIETFTLILTDAVGLAPPNMFFRDALINVRDSGACCELPLYISSLSSTSYTEQHTDYFADICPNSNPLLCRLLRICVSSTTK